MDCDGPKTVCSERGHTLINECPPIKSFREQLFDALPATVPDVCQVLWDQGVACSYFSVVATLMDLHKSGELIRYERKGLWVYERPS